MVLEVNEALKIEAMVRKNATQLLEIPTHSGAEFWGKRPFRGEGQGDSPDSPDSAVSTPVSQLRILLNVGSKH